MHRLRVFLLEHGLDAIIVCLAAAAALTIVTHTGSTGTDDVGVVFHAVAVVVMSLALTLRRRAPFAIPAGTWLSSATLSIVDGSLIAGQAPLSIVGMIAAVLLGDLKDHRQARAGLAVVVASAATVAYQDPTHAAGDLFFIPGLFAAGWLVGFTLHARTEQAEAAEELAARAEWQRRNEGRVAVAEERARIARELHDIVAHAVSVMVLQVGALRHRLPVEDVTSRETLRNVEEAGRDALTEMRRLLEAMRRDGDPLDLAPQPGLGGIAALLDTVRAAGIDTDLHVHGEAVDLPPGLALSAYRITQEGLTNVIKHAHTHRAEVHLRYCTDGLELEVRDDGGGPTTTDSLGHGLVGIRERVALYGGSMTAGPTETGGFALRARLPLGPG
ncbi:histidine kinase [Ornithinibacter aureus]|uniref:histidine kinase n=1 Tax=Ornithinibacter aureus TaxID=622664 RepID=A0ABP8J9R6_9MICO|nr:sensor histidine kinase [Ornithinibacter aureus]KAF0832853.1 signal transduction histidine kinase [Ornithinibacter aureus]